MKLPSNFHLLYPPKAEYQKRTIFFGISNDKSGLILPVGSGKTYCAINIARYRIQNNNVKKIIVLSPKAILYNWLNEIYKYSEYKGIVLHDNIRDNRLYLINKFKEEKDLIFGIINYDALRIYYDDILQLDKDMIIADESSRYIQTEGSQRTKNTIELFKHIQYKHILTATLIPNDPLNLWSQYMFMNNGKTFGNNYYAFRSRLFKKIKRFNKWALKPGVETHIGNLIRSSSIVIPREITDREFPGEEDAIIEIILEGKAYEHYQQIKEETISIIETELSSAVLNVDNIFMRLMKLQQFTSGFVSERKSSIVDKEEFGKCKITKLKNIYRIEKKVLDTPKLDSLIENVDQIVESDESVIVWCRFRFSLDMISKELNSKNINHVRLDGSTSDPYKIWKGFQNSNDINVFIGQMEAGGIGIELFKKEPHLKSKYQHMIFYEHMWNPDIRTQTKGRISRIGQKLVRRFIDLIVKDTIDERIIESVHSKEKIINTIMNEGIRGFLK